MEVPKDRIVELDQTIANLLADKTGWVDSRSSLIFWNLSSETMVSNSAASTIVEKF